MVNQRNSGTLIDGKCPGYVHSAQGIGLWRILGLPALVFFRLVYMVPLTMFTTYGVATGIIGGRTTSTYLIILAAMLFTAFPYSFMVKKYPITGSVYSYTSLSFGPCVDFLAGWSLLFDYLFLLTINYLLIGLFLNIAFPMVPAWVFVFAAIDLVTVLNVIGISSVASMSNVITGAQFVFVVVFVAMAVKHLVDIPSLDLSLSFVGDGSQPGSAPLMVGAAVPCPSFLGLDVASTLTERTRDSQRDIPCVTVITVVGAGLLSIVLAVFSQLVFPDSASQDAEPAANEVMLAAGDRFLASFFAATCVAGIAGSALASQASVPRILYSMDCDGILSRRVFGSFSERFKTPVIVILVVSVTSLLAVVIDPTILASMISLGALVALSVMNPAVIHSYLLLDGRRAPCDPLRYGLAPTIGLGLILRLWTSSSALTLVIGLTQFVAGPAYLALHTGGLRRKVPTVTLSEQN